MGDFYEEDLRCHCFRPSHMCHALVGGFSLALWLGAQRQPPASSSACPISMREIRPRLSHHDLRTMTGFPPSYYRTRIDSLYFNLQLAIIYGGVSVDVLIYWARKKWIGQSLRPFSIVEAGVLGVVALGPILAFRNGMYTMMGVAPESRSWSWDFAIAVWFFCVVSAATSAGLLLYGLQIGTGSSSNIARMS
jgi:hypothetical protein